MSVKNDSRHTLAAAPVFLPEAFLGREGLVRNMLWRLKRGESLSLCGGPKLGKTSLLLHLAWHLHHDSSSSHSSGPVGEYFDLAVEADCTRLMSRPPTADAIVCWIIVTAWSMVGSCLFQTSRRPREGRSCSPEQERGLIVRNGEASRNQSNPFPWQSFWKKKRGRLFVKACLGNNKSVPLPMEGLIPIC